MNGDRTPPSREFSSAARVPLVRRIRRRWAGLIGLCVVIAMTCVACSFGGSGSRVDHEAAVVAAVKQADTRAVDVSVTSSISGLSSGWSIDVVLSGADPVTARELGDILRAARDANKREPGHIWLYATGKDGSSIDLTAAADELGMSGQIGPGIMVSSTEMDDGFGKR